MAHADPRMSKTRQKLRRLFQPPSTTEGASFGARDLERPAREFNLAGEVVQPADTTRKSAQSPPPSEEEQVPGRTPAPTTKSPHYSPPNAPRAQSDRHPITFNHDTKKQPKSKSLQNDHSVRTANTAAQQTAPWAAANAFQSWAGNRSENVSTERASAPNARRSDAPTPDASPERTTRGGIVDVQRHAVVQGRETNKTTGPQASREFAAWREQRANREREMLASNVAPSDETATSAAPSGETVPSAAPQPRLSEVHTSEPTSLSVETTHEQPLLRPDLARDRVQRRALRSAQATPPPLSEKNKTKRRTTSAPAAEASDEAKSVAQAELSLQPTRQSLPPSGKQTPSEQLMWLIAHPQMLPRDEMVTRLQALEAAPLRSSHEARRLRLLASALLELERWEDALSTLHRLRALLPHDSWVSLTLAETYARDVATWAEALQWCEETLRLHPWLSKAKALRNHLEERLSQLN